ncbi:hypothetical protein BDW75DRAFT_214341 [Aspergillus navahoensis]
MAHHEPLHTAPASGHLPIEVSYSVAPCNPSMTPNNTRFEGKPDRNDEFQRYLQAIGATIYQSWHPSLTASPYPVQPDGQSHYPISQSQNPGFPGSTSSFMQPNVAQADYHYSMNSHAPSTVMSDLPLARESTPTGILQCRWEGCTYTRDFGREFELLRHIRLIHIRPRRYPCPVSPGCRAFNRKDNLVEHLRRIHGVQE